ncbi:MAG: efflux RND transporter permease subunit, partial [Gammaproteobacteria bacterium]
ITDPIEDVIVEIAEVDTVKSKSMVGLSVVQATIGDAVDDTDQVWDDVRAKVESVRPTLPASAFPPFVNSDFGDVYEIVFALYQIPLEGTNAAHVYTPRELEVLAERIEEEIELIDSVARVELWGAQSERIYVEVDSADWARLAITTNQLRDLFQARNIVFPGGEFDTESARYAVNPTGEFTSVRQMSANHTQAYAEAVRARLAHFANARITVDLFMLGPPIRDPVAFRLSGPDRDVIARKAREMVTLFKQTPGTLRPYSNWGAPAHQVEVAIDAYAANLAGVTNADIAFTTGALLSGSLLTTYREGDHLVPVMLRTVREKRQDLADLADIFVSGRYGKVPLNSIADVVPSWEPSVIARRNGLPTVTVGSRVEAGLLANTVSGNVRPKLDRMLDSLPASYFIEHDGELEETAKAQAQVVRAVGIAMVLMVLVLTIQYNSLAKPMVILFAVPMGMIGVLIGLLVTGWAMGFMAMLGVLSLGGIVINNAIVLVDVIETNVAEGQDLRTAVATAGSARMRPIILTTLTTIGGLLPLSLFGGALWAPMTNGMIFGLIVSTVLTLFVIPSLYVFMVDKAGMSVAAGQA